VYPEWHASATPVIEVALTSSVCVPFVHCVEVIVVCQPAPVPRSSTTLIARSPRVVMSPPLIVSEPNASELGRLVEMPGVPLTESVDGTLPAEATAAEASAHTATARRSESFFIVFGPFRGRGSGGSAVQTRLSMRARH